MTQGHGLEAEVGAKKRVYLVIRYGDEDYQEVVGVFTSRKRAEAAVLDGPWEIEPFELNPDVKWEPIAYTPPGPDHPISSVLVKLYKPALEEYFKRRSIQLSRLAEKI